MNIQEASGAAIRRADLLKEKEYVITEFGAVSGGSPMENTRAMNQAMETAWTNQGGTVVVPQGDFKIYTVVLKSNVNLRLEKHAVLRAARTTIQQSYETQEGEGGNYLEPEVNLYAGLQDHGHSYFANSLLYARNQENIMIYGEGTIFGGYIDEKTGKLRYTLMGGDPMEPEYRNERGHQGEWFGNKGIALVCCKNIVMADFSFVIGGHFAIIAEGTSNLYVEHILVDTTRDAFDIDCCQNVTVVHSTFNSLTDDALVIKASYGAGVFLPSKNILIEDCKVCGYDAGSVYAGIYSGNKLVATDSCGPTGRVKLGTESTCGYEKVTVRRVNFDRSRGFALEAVDGADLRDIIFEDCKMDNISSSPIFIRAGERGRFPVTGNSSKPLLEADENNVRLDHRNWVLPNTAEYETYPVQRYIPSYRKEQAVCIDRHSSFFVVNQENPARINQVNLQNRALQHDREQYYYANACGSKGMAKVSNVIIRNVTITNADPRYPIILMGLTDSRLENIRLEKITVTYRGGMTMEHAIEQRQLYTNWEYTQYLTEPLIQTLPWLVNPFFAKEETLLPRVTWDSKKHGWRDDPYNVPELPEAYPEPSNWGILPAYGIYARHVENLEMLDIKVNTMTPDERAAIVLDDVNQVKLEEIMASSFQATEKSTAIVLVENHYKRPTNKEYIPEEPYFATTVTSVSQKGLTDMDICCVQVVAPAPGTPRDSLYPYPTLPIPENGYSYRVRTEDYPLPVTVYRPFIESVGKQTVKRGSVLRLPIKVCDPASQVSDKESEGHIYNEKKQGSTFTVQGIKRQITITLTSKLLGASLERETGIFVWDTSQAEEGKYQVSFILDDNVIKENAVILIEIIP